MAAYDKDLAFLAVSEDDHNAFIYGATELQVVTDMSEALSESDDKPTLHVYKLVAVYRQAPAKWEKV